MALVGKQFPNIAVNATDKMGATFKINILNEAINNKKNVVLFWYKAIFSEEGV